VKANFQYGIFGKLNGVDAYLLPTQFFGKGAEEEKVAHVFSCRECRVRILDSRELQNQYDVEVRREQLIRLEECTTKLKY
jgi:hypothetical protein